MSISDKHTLIINADDFGLAVCVNEGIEYSHRHGILTSATLLANGIAFEDAIKRIKNNPNLGVGVHLNVVRGKPVTGSSELLDPFTQKMPGTVSDIHSRVNSSKFRHAVELEYRAQIEKVLCENVVPSHLDSEKHHAAKGWLRALMVQLAREYQIPAVRQYIEPIGFSFLRLPWAGIRSWFYSVVFRWQMLFTKSYRSIISMPDYFFGQMHIGQINKRVCIAILNHLPNGISELMTHPGYYDADEMKSVSDEFGTSWLEKSRVIEMESLCDSDVIQLSKLINLKSFRLFSK